MKRTQIIVLAVFTAVSMQVKAQQTMSLTQRQQSLSAIAALEAKGDMQSLERVLNQSLDNGLTVAEAKEAFSQLYAYTGFPRSLNALGVLQRVVEGRQQAGKSTSMGSDDEHVLPKDFDSLKEGARIQTQLSGRPFDYAFAPRTDYYLKAHLFGDIFAGQVLSHSDREIVTVSAISALEGCESQLRSHCNGALNMGVDEEQLRALPQVLQENVGDVEAWRLRKAIAAVKGEPDDEGRPVDFNIWPMGEPNTGYAQYFTGNSYLSPMNASNGGPSNVTFEPRCRNNWHIHHKAVQVLICVAGRGWYQEEGKEPVAMTPGTVIAIPAGVKHWHGAAKDSWFQHLAYHTHVEEGSSNEWLEPVSDEQYNLLP